MKQLEIPYICLPELPPGHEYFIDCKGDILNPHLLDIDIRDMTYINEHERGLPGRIVAFVPLFRGGTGDERGAREKCWLLDGPSYYWRRIEYANAQQAIDATVARLWLGMAGKEEE